MSMKIFNYAINKYSIIIYTIISICTLYYGSYLALFTVPDDYLQGPYFRILYIHVPAAWISMGLYLALSLSSIMYLLFKARHYALIAKSMAEVGIIFTALTIITGAIWGQPTWGTWWVWDARLTSVLILFVIYIGYIVLTSATGNAERNAFTSSVFAIVGLVNIPIIKFSVYILNTLHQKSTFFNIGAKGIYSTMHHSMISPIYYTTIGVVMLTCAMVALRYKTHVLRIRIKNSLS